MAEKALLSPARKRNANAQSLHARGRNQYAEVKIPGQGLFRAELVDEVMNSVCKVSCKRGETTLKEGTGFLGLIKRGHYEATGLFTNNHVFNIDDITENDFEIKCNFHRQKKEWYLAVGERNALFTCPVLDVTFISLTTEQLEEVLGRGCQVLSLIENCSQAATDGMDIIVMQYPGGTKQYLSQGKVHRVWGCDFYHTASTEGGSSGAPLVNVDGDVIAIHKGGKETQDLNVAVQVQYVIEAVLKDFCDRGPTHIPRVPISFSEVRELERKLNDKGLHRVHTSNPMRFKLRNADIWFERTAHFWYWTPTDPTARTRSWCDWRQMSPTSVLDAAGAEKIDQTLFCFLRDDGDEFL